MLKLTRKAERPKMVKSLKEQLVNILKESNLLTSEQLQEALAIFDYVFERDNNWRTLTRRLPASGLLSVSNEELEKILKL